MAFYRSRPDDDRATDEYFAAAANFVLAETYRRRAEAIEIPMGSAEEQHAHLERRASLMLTAQREYFNTMRFAVAQWAAPPAITSGRCTSGSGVL